MVTFRGETRRACALWNEDCSGPIEKDHIAYNKFGHGEIFQYLCHYHNCTEARELRFFMANQVLRGTALPGPLRIELNKWHLRYGLHPEFKKRIHEVSEANPLPEGFVPGRGQRLADEGIAKGRGFKFSLQPFLRDGKILGFRFKSKAYKKADWIRGRVPKPRHRKCGDWILVR
jgi:hypothetical protein